MKKSVYLLFIAVIVFACTKEEPLETTTAHPISKKIDTSYSNLNSLVNDNPQYRSIRDFMQQQQWKTTLDRKTTWRRNQTKIIQEKHEIGVKWKFEFPTSQMGNLIRQDFVRPVKISTKYLQFFTPPEDSSDHYTGTYDIVNSLRYSDNTFRLTMLKGVATDTMTVTESIWIESFK